MPLFTWIMNQFSKKGSSNTALSENEQDVSEIYFITPQELKERMDRGDALVLLDVREPQELKTFRLPNIVHIPMRQIPTRMNELNPQDSIVCICHVGGRSYQVACYLRDHGFQNILNLDGGMQAYSQEIDCN